MSETTKREEAHTGSGSRHDRLVNQPWLRSDKPWWWRQQQLMHAANEHAAPLIIYGQCPRVYADSIKRSRAARDDFYNQHQIDALLAGLPDG